jgi:hypothetical protein
MVGVLHYPVEGIVHQILCDQGTQTMECGWQVGRNQNHGNRIRSSQAHQIHNWIPFGDLQGLGDRGGCLLNGEAQHLGMGSVALLVHLVVETLEYNKEILIYLSWKDHGPLALVAHEEPIAGQLPEGLADGGPGNLEMFTQLRFCRKRRVFVTDRNILHQQLFQLIVQGNGNILVQLLFK